MLKVDKIIRILIFSDLVYQAAVGFVTPIFAVFLVDSFTASSLKIVGIAVAIHWLTKSVVRLPVAHFLDKWANSFFHIYIIQFFMGVGGAFAFTPLLIKNKNG